MIGTVICFCLIVLKYLSWGGIMYVTIIAEGREFKRLKNLLNYFHVLSGLCWEMNNGEPCPVFSERDICYLQYFESSCI